MYAYQILTKIFFQNKTTNVANFLLGKLLIHKINDEILIGRISETEAYYHLDDPASHSYNGPTKRNQAMFGPQGHAYIYRSYGMHLCLNAVAYDEPHKAGGVLIRGFLPLTNIALMQKNRGITSSKNIANGPGKVTEALGIPFKYYGINLTDPNSPLIIADDGYKANVVTTKRIGISKNKDALLRFVLK